MNLQALGNGAEAVGSEGYARGKHGGFAFSRQTQCCRLAAVRQMWPQVDFAQVTFGRAAKVNGVGTRQRAQSGHPAAAEVMVFANKDICRTQHPRGSDQWQNRPVP